MPCEYDEMDWAGEIGPFARVIRLETNRWFWMQVLSDGKLRRIV